MAQPTQFQASGAMPAFPATRRRWGALFRIRGVLGYAAAILLVAAAVGIKSIDRLGFGSDAPPLFLIAAVVVSSVVGGFGPGLLAAVLAGTSVAALYPPGGDRDTWDLERVAILAAFVVESLVVVAVGALMRRAAGQLRAETRRQSVLAGLAERALATGDERELFAAATEAVIGHLPADACLLLSRSAEGVTVVWSSGQRIAKESLDTAIGRQLLDAGESQALAVSEKTAGLAGKLLKQHGFHSLASTPIRPGVAPIRAEVLVALSKARRRPLGGAGLRFLETVAAMVTASAQRRAGEIALERSEERLRITQSAAQMGAWEWDLKAERMTWSDGLELLHGLAPGDFPTTATAYLQLVHQDDREAVSRVAREALGSGRFDVRYRIVTAAGRQRWIAARGQVFVDAEGSPARVVGVGVDVTEQMHTEERLRSSEENFRTMANAAPVLLRVKAPDGRCVFVNERWTELTGHAAAEHLGVGWLDFVHPDDREACRARLEASLETKTPDEWEYRIRGSQGEDHWMLDRNVPVHSPHGTLIGFVGSCTDITDRRNAEDALRFASESSAHLASSLDYEATLERFAKIAVPLFADWCVIFKRESNGSIRRVSVVHHNAARRRATKQLLELDDLNPGGDSIAARAMRDGSPILVEDVPPDGVDGVAAGEVRAALLRELDVRSVIAVPMAIQTSIIGAILFLRGDSGRRFNEHDLTLAVDLARRASVSIENARLYTNLRERESALERANEMLTFLLDASSDLSRTLDRTQMMQSLAARATPRVADWCAIVTLDQHGRPMPLAAAHRDPGWTDRVRELQERYPFSPGPDAPVMRALRDREPSFIPRIPDELLSAVATNEEHLALIHELGLRSAIILPIVGTRESYGVMTLVMSSSGRVYTDDDFATLQDFVHRAAIALDNATLFHEGTIREQELVRANEAKDEFMGMMSHELRTPLTVINGGARVLRSRGAELDSETKDEILSDIEGESERLFRMVENLLSLAHLEFSEPFDVEPVHAGHVSEKIIAAFRARRPDRQVTLTVEPGAETFAAQPVYFEQVVRNLLSNADKYSPRGAPIEVRVTRAGEGVGEFRVLDQGVGIDPDEAEAIFERFYRSERTARLVGGSGVGLALCKRLIEAMSGQIWARPREGGGLEVGFSLPLYEEAFV